MALVLDDTSNGRRRRHDDENIQSPGIILDALPYVETLDPHYEQCALSLIEEDLQQHSGREDHPSLIHLLPRTNLASFESKPGAAAIAYKQLLSKSSGTPEADKVKTITDALRRPDPMAARSTGATVTDSQNLLSDLQTSIETEKIRHEEARLHLINLELIQTFETSQRYNAYNNVLETYYLSPLRQAVERQRLRVDGINGTRMEEQGVAMTKMQVLSQKRDYLIHKNVKLEKAVQELEREVKRLRQTLGESQGRDDDIVDIGMEEEEI